MESPPSGLATGAAPDQNVVFKCPQNLVFLVSLCSLIFDFPQENIGGRIEIDANLLVHVCQDQFLFPHKHCCESVQLPIQQSICY